MHPPKIYGLIGYPVKHSLSPLMHNAAFHEPKYRLFEVKPEELEGFLLKNIPIRDTKGEVFSSQEIEGFNITIPHKVKAREILERAYPYDQGAVEQSRYLYYVKLSGAVNTVKREGGVLRYWNTDAEGFLCSLENDLKFNIRDKNGLIIGCGGAGRAIIAALSWVNVIKFGKIYVNDINDESLASAKEYFSRFPRLSNKLVFVSGKEIPDIIKDCQLLVNATPVGMKEGDGSVIDKSLLHENLSVYDVVYNRETQLVKDARSLGLPAADGLGMLLYQGVRSFEIWTGKSAPVEIMRNALEEGVKKL